MRANLSPCAPSTALGVTILALASLAHAEAPASEPLHDDSSEPVYDDSSEQYRPPKTERRGGFATATTIAYGLGEYQGYPLEVAALNDPSQKRSTGATLTSSLSVWFGGSPRDWITTGLGLSLMSGGLGETIGNATGILFHLEGFPLYSLGGTYRNLGLGFDGGLGVGLLFDKDDTERQEPVAESGSLSTLGFSAFWEPITFWRMSMGPAVTYTHAFSQTMVINQITLGFRTALYSSQP
jgi:hypothetical protein